MLKTNLHILWSVFRMIEQDLHLKISDKLSQLDLQGNKQKGIHTTGPCTTFLSQTKRIEVSI